MEKINYKIRKTADSYLFRDGKADSRLMAKVINHLIEKVNELVEEVEILRSEKTEEERR